MNFKYADLRVDNEILLVANQDSEEIIESDDFYNNLEYQYLLANAKHNYQLKQEELD